MEAFRRAKLTEQEWAEFDSYVKKFAKRRVAERMVTFRNVLKQGEY